MAKKNPATPVLIGGVALALFLLSSRGAKASGKKAGAGTGPGAPGGNGGAGGNGTGNGGNGTNGAGGNGGNGGAVPGGGGLADPGAPVIPPEPPLPGVIPGFITPGTPTPQPQPPVPELPIPGVTPQPITPLPGIDIGVAPSPGVQIGSIDPEQYDYPNFPPGKDINNYPTPGMFHQVVNGAMFYGVDTASSFIGQHICYQALSVAGYFAQKAGLLKAGQEVTTFARDPQMRRDYAILIICSPFQDSLYSQPNATVDPNIWVQGPNGRTTALFPRHANQEDRMAAGQSPLRTVNINTGARLPAYNAQNANRYPLLWLPAINLERLVEGEVTTFGMDYGDGSSRLNPHPEVMNLFLKGNNNIPQGMYGCPTEGYPTSEL